MARCIGAQGQVKPAKNAKNTPLVTSNTDNPKRKTEFFYKSKLQDFLNP